MTDIRPALLSIHRWIGLAFGLLLIVQALTGVAIVFREELNRTIHADALTVVPGGPAMPVQQMLDMVREAHSDAPVARIEYPTTADEAFLFRIEPKDGSHRRMVAVDPYRGVITRDGELGDWPIEWLFELHHELLAGDTGAMLVGIGGIALLFMALTGPFLWWPGRGRIRQGFSVTFRGGAYRGARDLHRVVGIIFALLLAVSAFTGIVMVWKAPLQPVINLVVPTISKPSVKVKERSDAALLPLDRVVAAAIGHYDGAKVRNVRFPGGTGRVVNVFLEADDYPRPRASNQIWLDGYTAKPLGTYEAAANPAGNGFIDWMLPIHSGEFLGTPGRWLFLFEALALAGFGLTGFWMWVARRRLQAAALPALPLRETIQVRIARVWDETDMVRAIELHAVDGGPLPVLHRRRAYRCHARRRADAPIQPLERPGGPDALLHCRAARTGIARRFRRDPCAGTRNDAQRRHAAQQLPAGRGHGGNAARRGRYRDHPLACHGRAPACDRPALHASLRRAQPDAGRLIEANRTGTLGRPAARPFRRATAL